VIKGKLKRNQYFTENATLALMLLNKPKQYTIPELKKSQGEHLKRANKEDVYSGYQLTSFDLNVSKFNLKKGKIKGRCPVSN
jgi:hypothetical protein